MSEKKLDQILQMQVELLKLFAVIVDGQVGFLGGLRVVMSSLRNLPPEVINHPEYNKALNYLDSQAEAQINRMTDFITMMGEALKEISENQDPPKGYG